MTATLIVLIITLSIMFAALSYHPGWAFIGALALLSGILLALGIIVWIWEEHN